MSITRCALCSNDASHFMIAENELAFCCTGCRAVHAILASKNLLSRYQETAVFQQAVRYGLIANPELLEQIREKQIVDEECEKHYFEVNDMWCPSCAEVVKLVISQEKGVKTCFVDYSTDLGFVEFSPKQISKEHVFKAIKGLGYQPADVQDSEGKAVRSSLGIRLGVGAFCSMNVMMFSYPLYASYFDADGGYSVLFAWLSLLFSIPVLLYSAWPIYRRFFTSLRVGFYGMETLVALGVASSFFLSLYELLQGGTRIYFDSMTVIIVFVLLGKIIESKAKFSAKESLFRLNRAIPKRGRKRLSGDEASFIPLKDIHCGDVLIVFAGEKIVLDGIVVEGCGSCDESVMTGESLPLAKEKGSRVLSGSILQSGRIAYRVTAAADQSTLQKIVDMVGKDLHQKALFSNYADRIVRWFVPAVLAIAFSAFFYSYSQNETVEASIIRAISVLLISCPCAIGIAAPLAESHLLQGLAKLGAIVRNRGCLRWLGKETLFVFDKTGTVTEGKFSVVRGLKETKTLGALASQSTHPMSAAIAAACGASSMAFDQIAEYAGKGIKGICREDVYLLGSHAFLASHEVDLPLSNPEERLASSVYFSKNNDYVTTIVLSDKIRSDAAEAIRALHPAKTLLLSGDSFQPVAEAARLCHFDEFEANCTPLKKKERIDQLREKHIVCMLGDGINDAPALAKAHIGISVVNAADISIQASDILLTTDRLSILPKMRELAKRGRSIMYQNLFWAFFYNVAGIGLAFFGLLSPLFASFAMVASSLMVLFNAKRL